MTEINSKILELIKQNKSLNEISQELSLSHKQIYQRLQSIKNNGYNITPKYYYTGDIKYKLNKTLDRNENISIITTNLDQEIELMAISDLHIGCTLQRLDSIDKIYNYCVLNNIHTIINCGDLINGSFGNKNIINDYEKQIQYFIKNYPYDKNILNYTCLGNHDIDCLKKNGLDLKKILENRRHDIIPINYGYSEINIKNEKIFLKHEIENIKYSCIPNNLILCGHSHKMSVNNLTINVPTLSDIFINESGFMPSALKIKLVFYNGWFTKIIVEQLLIGDKIYKINEIDINPVGRTHNLEKKIENEEYVDIKKTLSKLEKIKKKYIY